MADWQIFNTPFRNTAPLHWAADVKDIGVFRLEFLPASRSGTDAYRLEWGPLFTTKWLYVNHVPREEDVPDLLKQGEEYVQNQAKEWDYRRNLIEVLESRGKKKPLPEDYDLDWTATDSDVSPGKVSEITLNSCVGEEKNCLLLAVHEKGVQDASGVYLSQQRATELRDLLDDWLEYATGDNDG